MYFVGIDPGQTGAIAYFDTKSEKVFRFDKFEDVVYGALLDHLRANKDSFRVVLERQWGRPVSGAAQSFCIGCNYCEWKLLLDLAQVSYVEVPPMTWQKKILNTSKKKSAETKPLAIKYVKKRFPELDIPAPKKKADIDRYSGICDAICIALYGKFIYSGEQYAKEKDN